MAISVECTFSSSRIYKVSVTVIMELNVAKAETCTNNIHLDNKHFHNTMLPLGNPGNSYRKLMFPCQQRLEI